MSIIFVFGSNLAGRHGKGAALFAKENYGAEYGVGVGRTGNAYALPTKDYLLKVLTLDAIGRHLADFIEYAKEHPEDIFMLTPVGTGLAGYSREQIYSLLKQLDGTSNVLFTKEWFNL